MILRPILTAAPVFLIASTAQAHIGHLGELAGHSHWIGLAAGLGAAAIAGAIGLISDKDDEAEADESAEHGNGDEREPEAEGEAA